MANGILWCENCMGCIWPHDARGQDRLAESINAIVVTLSYRRVLGSRRTASKIQRPFPGKPASNFSLRNVFMPAKLVTSAIPSFAGRAMIHHFLPTLTSMNVPNPSESVWKPCQAPFVAQRPQRISGVGMPRDVPSLRGLFM